MLLRQTCEDIIVFVESSMVEQAWQPARDPAGYERATHLLRLSNILLRESMGAEDRNRDPEPFMSALSACVIEMADLARDAIAKGALRAHAYDTYPIVSPEDADAEYRRHLVAVAA